MEDRDKPDRGRKPRTKNNPINIPITIKVNQSMHDAIPKNEKGNPSQDWLREAIEEKHERETSGGVESGN